LTLKSLKNEIFFTLKIKQISLTLYEYKMLLSVSYCVLSAKCIEWTHIAELLPVHLYVCPHVRFT